MKVFSIVSKTIAVILAALLGAFSMSQVGWSGGDIIFNGMAMGAPELGVTTILFSISALVSIGCIVAISRISKRVFWIAGPIFLYSTLVAGIWNGYMSGFDATRAYLIKNGLQANAYALEHMGERARDLTCKEGRVELSAGATAICARAVETVKP